MVGRDRALSLIEMSLRSAKGDQAEVALTSQSDRLTRFANSEIHQNVSVDDTQVTAKVVVGRRMGVCEGNAADPEGITALLERAYDLARVLPECPGFPGLAGPAEYMVIDSFDEATASYSPDHRARDAGAIIALADKHGLNASGATRTRASETAIANSLGMRAYYASTDASCDTVIMGISGSGYAHAASSKVSGIGFGDLAEEAVSRCIRSENPGALEPGEYEAVFDKYAVSSIVFMLAYMGMNGADYNEGKSYASGMLGHKVTSGLISIEDNGLATDSLPIPFDYEGVPRQVVKLIDHGVAVGVVHDRASAAIAGVPSTGHAMPKGGQSIVSSGGLPIHLRLAPGDSSVEDMISSTEKGIFITRLHYCNPIHPKKTMFTGMTRDGSFLIENGRITLPLRNLRFTDSILEGILGNIEAVSSSTSLVGLGFGAGGYRVPAIKTRKFNVTGMTGY